MSAEEDWATDDEEQIAELYRLMGEKFFGNISYDDDQSLAVLLREPWALQEYNKFGKTFSNPQMLEKVSALLEKSKTGGLNKAFRKKAMKRLLLQGSLLTILVLLIVYLLPTKAPATGVRLQLANGKVISLTSLSNMDVSGTMIYNDTVHRLLSFSEGAQGTGEQNTLIVPAGSDYRVRLADGTDISLNADTRLSFPFSFKGPTRQITLSGEARLKVAKDAGSVFIVHLPKTDVEVLGTTFNINTYDTTATAISLQEGLIKVTTALQKQVLQVGSKATVAGNGRIDISSFAPEELSWQQGSYTMNNTPLGELEVVLPRWLGIKVVFDNPATKQERYFGTFLKKAPVDSLVKSLQHSDVDAYYNYKDSVLHIR